MGTDLTTIPSFSEVFKRDKNGGEMAWCGVSDIKPGDMIASAGLVDNEMHISFDEVISIECSLIEELVRYDGLIINREASIPVFDENSPTKICDNMCYDDLTDDNVEFYDNVPNPGRVFRGGYIQPTAKCLIENTTNIGIGSMELSDNEIHFLVLYVKYAVSYDVLHIPIHQYSYKIKEVCEALGFDVLVNQHHSNIVELLLSGGDIFVLLDEFYNYITIKEDTHGITVGYDSRLLWLKRKCFETFMYYDDNYKTSTRFDDTLIKTFMAMNTCHFTKGIDSPNTTIYENHCFKDNTPFGDISDINGSEDLITLYGIQPRHSPYIMIKQGDNIFIVNDMLRTLYQQ